MQLMGDYYNRFAVFLHIPDDLKQLLRLLRSQNCRRLVQNQDIRTTV